MKPICITMGDPAGLGPELIIRLLNQLNPGKSPALVLIGDRAILQYALERFGGKKAKKWFKSAKVLDEKSFPNAESRIPNSESPIPNSQLLNSSLNILNLSRINPEKIQIERGSAKHGKASWKYIEAGVKLCLSGICDGMITLPVNKESLLRAGCPYPGHTDLLAHLDGKKSVVMMMVSGKIRVALLTHHIPLKAVPEKIEKGEIVSCLKIIDHSLKTDFGISNPKIGVLGLNPHAGEDGRIGDEELKIILPAIKQAQAQGINAFGPIAGDTAFVRAKKREFDALLAMYHDQGISPLKALGFEKVVNVTLGLSFIRTSPGHGTAYDIAWQGIADPRSLFSAFNLAKRLIIIRGAKERS